MEPITITVENEVPPTVRRGRRRGDRPDWCPICQALVPRLRQHANAFHLPWYVDPTSACQRCEAQVGPRVQWANHNAEFHEQAQGPMPPVEWMTYMVSLLKRLAQRLGCRGFMRLPDHVRDMHLNLTNQPNLHPCEEQYFDDWHGEDRAFDPCSPRHLRDCSHWKIVLRLIAQV